MTWVWKLAISGLIVALLAGMLAERRRTSWFDWAVWWLLLGSLLANTWWSGES